MTKSKLGYIHEILFYLSFFFLVDAWKSFDIEDLRHIAEVLNKRLAETDRDLAEEGRGLLVA